MLPDWKARAGLVLMAAACLAGAVLIPLVPDTARNDILAAGLGLGGLAMLIVAMWPNRTNGRKGELTMRPIRNLIAEREWKQRTGRFALCDADEPGREQVMPGEKPEPEAQTHTRRGDGGYRDGA